MAGLVAIGRGAYALVSGALAWVLAIGVPLLVAVCWAVFNVPGDGSRSGEAPVPVPGLVRLLLELAVFTLAVVLILPVSAAAAVALAGGTVIHYLLSIDRIRWLLAN